MKLSEKEFATLLQSIKKKFGDEMIVNEANNKNIEILPSGSLLIDEGTGVGGYPRGRIIELYGPESSGKTTLALQTIKAVQEIGEIAAFIDVEHSIDLNFAQKLGIDLSKLIISQPNSGEQALELLLHLAMSEKVALVVVDSVAALLPKEELEGRLDEYTIGAQARLMAKSLRKLNTIISKGKLVVIFINQIREKVGVIFGNPEITPGGRALKFYASLRIEIRVKERMVNAGEIFGQRIRVKIVKNKLAIPYRQFELEIYYDHGIHEELEIFNLALKYNFLRREGSWFYFDKTKLGQGRENALNFLKQKNLLKELKEKLLKEIQK